MRAKPWRKLRVEHKGIEGTTMTTRVIFDNPKVALSDVEVIRDPEGAPELAHVQVRAGSALTAQFDDASRPSSLEGSDGARALLSYKGTKATVTFVTASGKQAGQTTLRVPVELRSTLRLAHLSLPVPSWSLIAKAHAQQDKQVLVEREVHLQADIRTSGKGDKPGQARIQASCAPFTCLPLTRTTATPGPSRVRIGVTGAIARSKLGAAPKSKSLARYKDRASDERDHANDALPYLATVIAAVTVTAKACVALKLNASTCVPALAKITSASGAIHSVSSHRTASKGPLVDQRALELYYEEQARAALDKPVSIEVCFSRSGYTRACIEVAGRPLGAKPMPPAQATVAMKRGISGTVEGSFVMTQSDGADCKFSPSPRTEGPVSLTFDSKTGVVTAKLSANGRGTRSGLSCSLGSGDMRWTQNYSATMTQSFSPQQLEAGGKLALNLRGTMSGSGSQSQSNCRTRGGASANCPAGRSNSYNHPIQLVGNLDLDTQTGSGRLVISGAPLSTSGSWRIPAEGAAP